MPSTYDCGCLAWHGNITPGASFGGAGGPSPPPPKKKKKRKKKEKKKKKKKEKKKEKRKKRTMNNIKLLHIKCCFFQFFNSSVALKNQKKCWPLKKKLKWCPCIKQISGTASVGSCNHYSLADSRLQYITKSKTFIFLWKVNGQFGNGLNNSWHESSQWCFGKSRL